MDNSTSGRRGMAVEVGRPHKAPIMRLQELSRQDGISFGWQLCVFLLVLAALFSRDTSLFTHAQFFAEDGKILYAQAYNEGWLHSLTVSYAGYLITVQRLGAGFAMLVPLRVAPLAMMLWGLLVQALPVPILLSARCRNWGSLPIRVAFATAYIGIPNEREIHVVCTNAQWHLGFALLLLAFAARPRCWAARAFDVTVFAIGSVSGPFGILLLPFLLAFWWVRRQSWTLATFAVLLAGSALQFVAFEHNKMQRFSGHLGATLSIFVRMLGGDVFLGALLGSHPFGVRVPLIVSFAALAVGITICTYYFRFASPEVRLFIVYCFVLFAAELHNPATFPTSRPLWMVIVEQPSLRYWFFPSLPFLFAILWSVAFARSHVIRAVAVGLALLLCIGICKDWFLRPMTDLHFEKAVAAFRAAPPGTNVVIPICPPGWQMELLKKS